MSLTFRLLNYLSRRSRRSVWLIALGTVLVLGVIDYATGTLLTISFFYLLPVSMVSWSLGKRSGWVIAIIAAAVLEGLQVVAGGETIPAVIFWNLAVRLSIFLVIANLIAELRHLLKYQTELSQTDSLTGILNRRAFKEAGELELSRMREHLRALTFAFIDIDDFKALNDSYGHAAGDQVLVTLAARLKSQLWGTDILARLGGDEFGILLPHTDEAAALKVIPRIRETLLQEMSQAGWPVTFSIGVVTCLVPPPNINELVEQADELMYASKRQGKDFINYALYPAPAASAESGDEQPVSEDVLQPQ